MADTTLTPLEVFVVKHAIEQALEAHGDDAVLQSARVKLASVLEVAQRLDPALEDTINAHRELMIRAASEAANERSRERRVERLRELGLPVDGAADWKRT